MLLVVSPNDIRESYVRHLVNVHNDTVETVIVNPLTETEKRMWKWAAHSSFAVLLQKNRILPRATSDRMFWKYFGKSFPDFPQNSGWDKPLYLKQEPWQVKALDGSRPPQEHVFFGHLRGRAAYPIDGVSARFAALTDERISEYAGALPPSWAAEAQTVATARTFIMSLRDNLAPAGTELKRALS